MESRALKILDLIVDEYIRTGEPIGSKAVQQLLDIQVSSATIRNEMASLEQQGYLEHPHTSAGRVPSEKGYKLYVDMLMSKSELSNEEKKLIEDCIQNNVSHIKDLIQETSKLLSQLTNYTTVAVAKSLNYQNVIKHIQLVSMENNKILLIVVTNNGDIKKAELTSNIYLEQSKLNIISDNLTKKLLGKNIVEIDERLIAFIKFEIGECSNLIDGLIDALNFNMSEEEAVFSLNGATNILNYPEFNDVIKAKSFLNMIDKKETIDSMLKSKGIQKDNVNIIIGSDNDLELAKDCSIVTATYNIDKDLVGKISFIGPTRMDYARIYAIVNYINLLFNKK